MIIKDLLDRCQLDEIVPFIMEIDGTDESKRDDVTCSYRGFVEKLKMIEPVDTGMIAFIIQYFDYMEDRKEIWDVPVYRKDEILAGVDPNCVIPNDRDILSKEEIDRILSDLKLPDSYAFEFSPWEEILGYEIFLPNIEKNGLSRFMAHILYEMTFFGFSQEDLEKERKELDEAIAEVEEILKLPKEEQEKRLISMEDVFEELGLQDERIPEEKEADSKRQIQNMLENHVRTYTVLKEYYNVIKHEDS